MIIYQVAPTLNPNFGGPAIGAISIHNELKKLADTKIWLRDPKAYEASQNSSDIIAFVRPPFFWHLEFMHRFWKSDPPCFVHLHGNHLPIIWLSALVCMVKKWPYSIQPHGTLEPYDRKRKRLKKSLFMFVLGKRIMRKAAVVVVATNIEKQNAVSYIPGIRCSVLPLGVNLESSKTPPRKRPRQLIFVGRLTYGKNPDFLIALMSELPEFNLKIVGPESEWGFRDLQALANANQCQNVEILGENHGMNLSDLLCESEIYLLPSVGENFSLTTIEAMSQGVFPIVSEQTGVSENFELLGFGEKLKLDKIEWLSTIRKVNDQIRSGELDTHTMSLRTKRLFSWEKFAATLVTIHSENEGPF